MSVPTKDSAREMMAQISALNEEIVEARRAGQDLRVESLKARVQTLLTQGIAASQKTPPAAVGREAVSPKVKACVAPLTQPLGPTTHKQPPEHRAHRAEDHHRGVARPEKSKEECEGKGTTMSKIARIHGLNEQIVEARKAGDFARVETLKAEVQALLLG